MHRPSINSFVTSYFKFDAVASICCPIYCLDNYDISCDFITNFVTNIINSVSFESINKYR